MVDTAAGCEVAATPVIPEAVMQSRYRNGADVRTPHLEFTYQPIEFSAFREDGSSWDVLTYDVAQPKGIAPLGGVQVAR